MNVNLTPQLEEMVRAKVSSGMYTSASEVVREALRLMQEQDRLRQVKLEQLRRDSRNSLKNGSSEPMDAPALQGDARTGKTAKLKAAARHDKK
ncbi:type II toxin-antitoxin system ParD family antitoxin [Methyloversatilis sp. NSM2]|uniref:type II toxin-antitoxin system ParD family antitoxin n=1 Tax=Methyloversatilis sp. NSM2 TaxID=3134135 RepID=UPI003110E48B